MEGVVGVEDSWRNFGGRPRRTGVDFKGVEGEVFMDFKGEVDEVEGISGFWSRVVVVVGGSVRRARSLGSIGFQLSGRGL